MKKTVSVNIKGTNFLIEEDAYELLQDYLDRLNSALKNDEGSKEIIEDVELRIAEICSAKLSDTKTVIELADIEEILATLGSPSDFVDEDEESKSTINDDQKQVYKNHDKRLFRDTENSYAGGVCSGLASYFGIDVIIMRILFFVFSTIGFPLYIVLWIVVPKAETTIDRLRMKGEPVTVESVKQEVGHAAERIKTGAKSISRRSKSDAERAHRSERTKRVFATIFGLGFLIAGITSLIGFLVVIIFGLEFMPAEGANGLMSMTELGSLVLNDPGDVSLAWIGGLMVSITAILFHFLMTSLLLFRIRTKWTKYAVGGLILTGIAGIIICISIGVRTGRDFVFDGKKVNEIGISSSEELVIIPRYRTGETMDIPEYSSNNDFGILSLEGDNIKGFGVDIRYVPSDDTLFHVKQILSSRGGSRNAANFKSKNIIHKAKIVNDTLYIDADYLFPKSDKLRDQEVIIYIEVPEGCKVKYKNKLIHIGRSINDDEGDNEEVDHPYYEQHGRILGDGRYQHHQYRNESVHINSHSITIY